MRYLAPLLFGVLGCGSASPPATPRLAEAIAPSPARRASAETTQSPHVAAIEDHRAGELAAACGEPDGALARVAAKLAHGDADPDRAAALLREEGEPHLRPTVYTSTGTNDERLSGELRAARTRTTRCGVAADGDRTIALSVEALADLAPLPIRARTGQWLAFDATLRTPARSAKLVILPPRGAPRTVPTSIDRGRVRARFALDRPGDFTVQLVADLERGPLPVLEARVFADVEPSFATAAAPGESASEPTAEALREMIAAARSEDGLPPLARDERLDALARAHANDMRERGVVAHDLGRGDLTDRFNAESLSARLVGENVAKARTLSLAHRALYASPSHRMNLLRSEFTRVGIAVEQSADAVWVCEVFASP